MSWKTVNDCRPLRAPILFAMCLSSAGCDMIESWFSDSPEISHGVNFQVGVLQVQEGDDEIEVAVTLDGDTLDTEAQVGIVVDSASTAAEGNDYVLSATQLTFPSGSPGGTTRSVMLTVLNDGLLEGGETVKLRLEDVNGDLEIGPTSLEIDVTDAEGGSVQFVDSEGETDEAGQPHLVDIELLMAQGVTLARDVTVTIVDRESGTASAGADYVPLGTRTFTIPAGSSPGTVYTLSIEVESDSLVENDETIELEIIPEGNVLAVGGNGNYTLSITDDDGYGGLVVRADGSILAHRGEIDLGSPGDGEVELTLQNLDTADITVFHPEVVSGEPGDVEIHLQAAGLEATAREEVDPGEEETLDIQSPLYLIPGEGAPGVSAGLDVEALRAIEGGSRLRVFGFPLPGLGEVELELSRLASPWTRDGVISVDHQRRRVDTVEVLERMSLWSGQVAGDDGSNVFLRLSERGCNGWVASDLLPGGVAHISPRGNREETLVHGIALSEQLPSPDALPRCAGTVGRPGQQLSGVGLAEMLPAPGSPEEEANDAGAPEVAALTLSNVRLAIETDYQLYTKFGDQDALVLYVTELIAAVSELYVRDLHTSLSISYLGVYTTPADPWTDTNKSGDRLTEFRQIWSSSGWPVDADLAHFLSTGLDGGVAYVDVICDQRYGFGVSTISGNVNWSNFDLETSPDYWDYIVVAHELGHNFGALHTHDYCPPLDQCADNCTGEQISSVSTIMSYCSRVDLRFHPQIANLIRSNLNGNSCIDGIVLAPNDMLRYFLSFTSGAVPASVTIQFEHSASNIASPFEFTLTGGN